MLSRRYSILMEVGLTLGVVLFAAWVGWSHVSSVDDVEMLRETKTLPIPVFTGAIHFALGRGVGVTLNKEEGFPELEAFLTGKIAEIPRESWPDSRIHARGGDHYLYMHYYLIVYLGTVFRLFGISVESFRIACVLLHVLSMLAVYGIFRLAMGRALSVLLVAFLSTSRAYLVMLPILRDLGKAPFLLGAMLLMGLVLRRATSSRMLYLLSVLLGAVIGVGYGFRQDVFVCLPLALFCILAGWRSIGGHPWRARIGACLLLTAVFSLCAVPVFRGNREVGGTITVHTIFQGLMRCSEDNAAYYSNDYDFGFLNYDHPVIAQMRGFAKRTGDTYPLHDLTPAYGEVGKHMFREFVRAYPADLAGRVLAVADTLFGILATPFIWEAPGAEQAIAAPNWPDGLFQTLQLKAAYFLDVYGFLIALVALILLAAWNLKAALFLALFLGYFSAYPSLLFEYRHYYYLAFVPCLFAGLLLALLFRSAAALLRSGWRQTIAALVAGARAGVRGFCFVLLLFCLTATSLWALRFYQDVKWSGLLKSCQHASLAPVAVREERQNDTVRLFLERPISEWPGMRPAGDGEVTQAYLALRFRGAERTVSFRLMNNNPVLSRPCTILLEDAGTYFFPVYDFFFKEPFVFQGIEISLADRSLLEGMYVFEGAEALPLWPYVFVPEEGKPFEGYKTGRLDRDLLGLSAEIRSAFGFWPEEGVAAYLPLIRRFPFHEPYVERALAHAARCRDESFRLALWEVLGKYVPERRLEAGRFFASRADEALAAGEIRKASDRFRTAARVLPGDMQYQIRIGELCEVLKDAAGAMEACEMALKFRPEDLAVAARLQGCYARSGKTGEARRFWQEIVETWPEAKVPQLYLGITLENMGLKEEAVAAYETLLRLDPAYGEALYRLGAIRILEGAWESGAAMMREAVIGDVRLKSEISRRCMELADCFEEWKDHDFAARMYELALEISPGDLWPLVNLGRLYEQIGDDNAALSCYRQVLATAPESPVTAAAMHTLLNRMMAGDAVIVAEWRALAALHSGAAVPALYLGIALEEAGDREGALIAYKRALNRNPALLEAWDRAQKLEQK